MDLRELSYGVELETVGATREAVARAIHGVVGGEIDYIGSPHAFDPWEVRQPDGRVWKVVKDGSLMNVPDHLRAEVVSPVLGYGDIEPLQGVIRAVRATGARTDATTAVHIHVGAAPFDDRRPPAESRLTALDVAVWTYLVDRDLLDTLYAQMCVRRRRAFSCYRAYRGQEIPDELPGGLVAKLEEAIDEYDEGRDRGRHCRVSLFIFNSQVWFTIRRGDAYRREVDLEKKQVSLVFRPERYNTVILDRAAKELRINATTDDEVRLYESLFGELLCGSNNAFFDSAKFTLAPIVKDGAACVSTSGVPRLEWARLVKVQFRTRRKYGQRSIIHNESQSSEDLFKTMAPEQWQPEGGELVQVTFRLKFARSDPRTVTIALPNSATFTRDSDCVEVERWLEARGFVLPLPENPPHSMEKLMQMSLEHRIERNRFTAASPQV